jgi:hypothetical protein
MRRNPYNWDKRPRPPEVDPRDEAGIPYLCYLVELALWRLRMLQAKSIVLQETGRPEQPK